MQEIKQKEDNKASVGFDGRSVYFRIFEKHSLGITQAVIDNDFEMWHSLLRTMYSMLRPFMAADRVKEIDENFRKVGQTINNYTFRGRDEGLYYVVMKRRLHDLNEQIYDGASHMLLPKKSETDDFEDGLFGEGSDI